MNNNTFKEITAGKLKIKIEADKADKNNSDTKVYEQEIDLSQKGPHKIDVNGIQKGVDYILTETEAPDGYTISKNKYRIQFAQDSEGKLLIKLMAVIGPDGEVLKGIKDPKEIGLKTELNLTHQKVIIYLVQVQVLQIMVH